MQKINIKVAIVVKGYYKKKTNEVFGIYILDEAKLVMIPCDNDLLDDIESFDCLGDIVSDLKKRNYKVQFDLKEETNFDVSQNYPTIEK